MTAGWVINDAKTLNVIGDEREKLSIDFSS